MSIEEVVREALKLAPGDRAKLAHQLVLSLSELNEEDIQSLWLEEARRRDQGMDEVGRVAEIPGDEILARIRSRLA